MMPWSVERVFRTTLPILCGHVGDEKTVGVVPTHGKRWEEGALCDWEQFQVCS